LIAQTPGRPAAHGSVTGAAGERKHVAIDAGKAPPPAGGIEPPPPPPPEGNPRQGLRTASYVADGVGVAGLATFAVFGVMARSTYNSLQSECPGPCTVDHGDQVSSG